MLERMSYYKVSKSDNDTPSLCSTTHTHTPYQKSFAIKTTVTISLNLYLL